MVTGLQKAACLPVKLILYFIACRCLLICIVQVLATTPDTIQTTGSSHHYSLCLLIVLNAVKEHLSEYI